MQKSNMRHIPPPDRLKELAQSELANEFRALSQYFEHWLAMEPRKRPLTTIAEVVHMYLNRASIHYKHLFHGAYSAKEYGCDYQLNHPIEYLFEIVKSTEEMFKDNMDRVLSEMEAGINKLEHRKTLMKFSKWRMAFISHADPTKAWSHPKQSQMTPKAYELMAYRDWDKEHAKLIAAMSLKIAMPSDAQFDELDVEFADPVSKSLKTQRIQIRRIIEIGFHKSRSEFMACLKVSRRTKRALQGRSKIWVPLKDLAKTRYLHGLALDIIWKQVKDVAWRDKLTYIVVGAKSKKEKGVIKPERKSARIAAKGQLTKD